MSAVKLPDWDQVKSRNEEPEPSSHECWVFPDRRACMDAGTHGLLRETYGNWIADQSSVSIRRDMTGLSYTVQEKRNACRKASQGTGRADVDELSLALNRRLDTDDCPKGPGRELSEQDSHKRRGDEERKRCGQPVASAHQIVAHLVSAKDHEKWDRKWVSICESSMSQPASFSRELQPARQRRGREGRGEEREVEERMFRNAKAPALAARGRGRWRETLVGAFVHPGRSYLTEGRGELSALSLRLSARPNTN